MLPHVLCADRADRRGLALVPGLAARPGGHRRNAPRLGQDTDAVLREVGLTEEQIAALKDRGVIRGEA